jgi:hypothetical protein
MSDNKLTAEEIAFIDTQRDADEPPLGDRLRRLAVMFPQAASTLRDCASQADSYLVRLGEYVYNRAQEPK